MTIHCLHSRAGGISDIVSLSLTGAEHRVDWHATPKLGVTVILGGFLDIEINRAAPSVTTLAAGDVLLVVDYRGEGHRSRAHSPVGLSALLLPLAAADVPALAAAFVDWPADIVGISD